MALSTNRTLITQTGINTHQVLNVGGLDSAGIATFSNFKTGFSNVHSIGFDVGSAATIRSTGNASFTGVVTALKFVGDISEATGAAAGLGTALSQTQTDPLNKVYYTNKVLSISTTTTIDHPATANLAYTQYSDIKIENGHDLIIKDGDDFKYDILGLSTTRILDTNNFPDGLRGDLTGDVTGNVTGDVTGNVTGNLTGNVTGNVTGSGANLTNIPAGQLTGALPAISGANLTGVPSFPTHIDIWRITTDMSLSSGDYLTSNWNRAPQSSAEEQLTALKGAQVTESSGVFTFPTTGIWQIMFQIEIYKNGSCRWFEAGMIGTVDNFSSERVLATGYGSLFNSGANTHTSVRTSTFYKVSNVSNNKIKFRTNMSDGVTNESSSTANNTWVEFVRVSDI